MDSSSGYLHQKEVMFVEAAAQGNSELIKLLHKHTPIICQETLGFALANAKDAQTKELLKSYGAKEAYQSYESFRENTAKLWNLSLIICGATALYWLAYYLDYRVSQTQKDIETQQTKTTNT